MKVILLQELKGRGGEGDVIEVARGYAVNYLLPRKIAIEATPGNLKQLEQRMHNIKKREEQRLADAQGLAAALEGKVVTIAAKVGDEGRLFGSVTAQMIQEAIQEQLGVEVDRRRIETHGHIKEVGAHTVDITLYRDVSAKLTVEVVPEGASAAAPAVATPAPTEAASAPELGTGAGEGEAAGAGDAPDSEAAASSGTEEQATEHDA